MTKTVYASKLQAGDVIDGRHPATVLGVYPQERGQVIVVTDQNTRTVANTRRFPLAQAS